MLGICFQSQLFFFALLLLLAEIRGPAGCSLPRAWRPQSDECRAELAESIVFAHVRAVRAPEPGEHRARGRHVPIPGLLYTAELELICDQAWGSMLTLPMGTRFNLTGLGYFSCYSYTVMPNNSYFIFLRLNYLNHFVPHGVNFQDGIFPDTEEMRRLFADRFQFANCTAETQLHTYTSRWQDRQEEEILCSPIQKALLEEEERSQAIEQELTTLKNLNHRLLEKVNKLRKVAMQAKEDAKKVKEAFAKLQARFVLSYLGRARVHRAPRAMIKSSRYGPKHKYWVEIGSGDHT
uniref:coiled-coil domain-containing protein 3 isoform X1 n=1 Tax=Myxine glutinosa TaxID=7769 RepID=UPI00358F0B9E